VVRGVYLSMYVKYFTTYLLIHSLTHSLTHCLTTPLTLHIIYLIYADIEEITHKAGNFKKFDTFVMMLSSAFARESDTVYVDLLTYNDLEMMKARKVGGAGAGGVSTNSSFQSQNSSTSRSQMKRYVC
jgi:hypothetical protein